MTRAPASFAPIAAALIAALATVSATAQVRIDSHGIRTGDTVIDATGIHARGASVDATGVHRGPVARGGERVIVDNNLVQQIDCGGGSLSVNGNHNRLTLANCRAVSVPGNHNIITARFAAPGSLTVAGNFDQITYSTAPRVAVAVSNVGNRSSVTRR